MALPFCCRQRLNNMASYVRGLNYSQSNEQHNLAQPWRLPRETSRGDISYGGSQNVELTSNKLAEPLIFDPGQHFTPHQNPSSFQNSFLYNWWLSIASVVVSVLAILAIIALLIVADKSSLPKLPLSVTMNVYISDSIGQLKWLWFRQPRALQDIQIFDEASRGAL